MLPSRLPIVLLAVALLIASGCSGPSEEQSALDGFTFTPESPPVYETDGLRVATLNAEFLFDGRGNEGQATFSHKGDPAKSRAHRDKIGEILRMIDADVVMLQEVEHRAIMGQLVRQSLSGMGYAVHFVQGKDTFTGQDVGLLARVPVDTVGRVDERAPVSTSRQTYGVSKNLFARLTLSGRPVTLIGLHFLARPTDPDRKARREAQAEVIRRLTARELAAGRAVGVLGDFNDFDRRTPDLAASQPITHVLQCIKDAGPGPDDDLRNVMAEVPQRDRFTAHWDRDEDDRVDADELSALDHILLSPALYRKLRAVRYVQAYDPTTHTDHFPIVITLALRSQAGE